MPTNGTKKQPANKPSQSQKSQKPTKADSASRYLEILKKEIGRKFSLWRKPNQSATLGDLLQFLDRAQDELLSFDGDDLLVDIECELSDAANWLATWESNEGCFDDEKPLTVEYRLANMEEDISQVEELVEELGESFIVKLLPKWKSPKKSA